MDKCDGDRSNAETRGLRVMVNGVGSGADQAGLENGLWGQCGGDLEVSEPRCSEDPKREAWHTASGQQHAGNLMSRESEEGGRKSLGLGGPSRTPRLLSKYYFDIVTGSFN